MIDLAFAASFVARFEGFVGHVYRDAVGVETIGYGETDPAVINRFRQTGMTQAQALELLKARVAGFADGVAKAVAPAQLTPAQHEAFTSLAYNIGLGAFSGSSACHKFKAGDVPGAAEAIKLWNKAGGKVLPGLTTRRAAELALFTGKPVSTPDASTAQASDSFLSEGANGPQVAELQRLLNGAGFHCTADGDFGPLTTAAVKACQTSHKLDVDGVVGPQTWAVLKH